MAVAAESYTLVDEIPEVDEGRQAVRQEAWQLMDERRQNHQRSGEAFAPPVDALSTAHAVLATAETYGDGSAEHIERYQGLVLDCQRLVAEWYRKKKPEYFPAVRHRFDEASEEFFSHGMSIAQMTRNALLPIDGNAEEEARRVNERVEDATPQLLRKLGKLAAGGAILTLSECTDKAEADYAADLASGAEHGGYDGYVPEIRKLMARVIMMGKDSADRFEEQVAMPGIYHTHDILLMTLERRGLNVAGMDKTRLHGSQILINEDLMDFVARLDEVASEQWCTNIFMGEEVAGDYVKDYDNFRQEALARQEGLQNQAQVVAEFVLGLARDDVGRREALVLVEDFVKKLLLDLAKHDPTVAEQMFDEKTAAGLQRVAYLEANGRNEEAFELMKKIEEEAPGGGYCGGGCGIESVDGSNSQGRALATALKAGAGDKLGIDKVRSCKCGGTIAYAWNDRKYTKACKGCGKSETKVSVVSSQNAE